MHDYTNTVWNGFSYQARFDVVSRLWFLSLLMTCLRSFIESSWQGCDLQNAWASMVLLYLKDPENVDMSAQPSSWNI
ncbi:hypothetical protein HYALB_00000930 [Hymenoscyphus albidus]|uniref:Uncharacterized protein n=1 Tax=Hymenoscyphus albidus TaxID=595503 RepID=A0A9N9Q0S4_9HELO|nr:hypothetical protein HYALB_00000930 [Hymenoscyphus albidus]